MLVTHNTNSCHWLSPWQSSKPIRCHWYPQCVYRHPWCQSRWQAWSWSCVRKEWVNWCLCWAVCVPSCCHPPSLTTRLSRQTRLPGCQACRLATRPWFLGIRSRHLRSWVVMSMRTSICRIRFGLCHRNCWFWPMGRQLGVNLRPHLIGWWQGLNFVPSILVLNRYQVT